MPNQHAHKEVSRRLRLLIEHDTWSCPIGLKAFAVAKLNEAMPQKHMIDEWVGGTLVFRPELRGKEVVARFDPPEHFSWDSSQ